jgi:hypothetical protein
MAILDFSKAFDRVPHQRLLRKLDHYGIRSRTHSWISDFLSNRQQQVVVDGERSEAGPVVSGVPQGTVLGPVLFLLFINDLPSQLKCKTRLFADDCIVYNEIKSQTDCTPLQEDLFRLASWEQTWGMEFHPEKCYIMSVTRARSPKTFQYMLKGHTLERVSSAKYLGVHLSSDLNWKPHVGKTIKKANSALGFLRRNLRSCSTATRANAYNTLVRPHLEYCSSVWSPYRQDQVGMIEMVQRRAARYTTNRYHNTSSVSSMLQDLGWQSLESRRQKTQLTMFFKIVNDLVDIRANDYLTPTSSRTRANNSRRFRQISTRTDTYKFSFFPRTIPAWNSLPAAVAEAPCLVSFKRELSLLPSPLPQ